LFIKCREILQVLSPAHSHGKFAIKPLDPPHIKRVTTLPCEI